MRRRLLAIFLTLTMALAVFPASALATGDDPDTGEPSEDISTCTCTELCTADAVNSECPVCAENYSACEGSAPEETGDEPTEEPGEPQQPESTLTEESTQVELLQARIDALPTVEELSAMETEARDTVIREAYQIDDALTEELRAQLDTDKLDAIFDWLNVQAATQPDDTNEPVGEAGTEKNPWNISAEGEENNVTAYLTQNNEDDENPTYTLTISGEGAMEEFAWGGDTNPDQANIPPWNNERASITATELPEGLTTIGTNAFWQTGITEVTIPDGVTYIGNRAFHTTDVTTEIPASVQEIGVTAFSGDFTVTVASDSPYFEVEDGILYTKGKTHIVKAPTTFDGENGNYIVPSTVTSVGRFAFSNATQLTSVDFSRAIGLTEIGASAFNGSGITSVEFPTSVSSLTLGAQAFYQTKLETLTLPLGLTEVGANSFRDIETLESVTLPASVTAIGDQAFYDCTELVSINLPENLETIGRSALRNTALTSIHIPASVTEIADYAFYITTSVMYVTFPERMASSLTIGDQAFRGTSIISLTLPEGLTSIGDHAFRDCTSLQSVVLPSNTLETIGTYAFQGCSNLISVQTREAPEGVNVIPGSAETIGGYAFYPSKLTGPLYFEDGVETIGDYAFQSANYVTAVYLPSTIQTVGQNALYALDFIQSNWDTSQSKAVIYCADDDVFSLMFGESNDGDKRNYYSTSTALANLQGGTLDMTDFSEQFVKGALLTPEREGAAFASWHTDKAGESESVKEVSRSGKTQWAKYENDYYVKWTESIYNDPGDWELGTMTYGHLTPKTFTVSLKDGQSGMPSVKSAVSSNTEVFTTEISGATVTVTPNPNLPAGTYQETITITTDDDVFFFVDTTLTVVKAVSIVTPGEGSDTITATYGDTITLTAEVAKAPANGIALFAAQPDTVDFYCGSTLLGSAEVTYTNNDWTEGTATLVYDTRNGGIPVGTSTITAEYGGSVNLNESKQNFIEVTLNKANTTVSIFAAPTSLIGGGTVTLTVDTSKLPEGGTVSVSCDKDDIKIVENDNGTYTAEMPNRGGEYTFTAVYNGDAWYNGATATCTVTVVTKATPVEPVAVGYIVEHYLEGRWGYELEDTEFFTGEIGDTVTAQPKDYPGYRYNERISTASGTLIVIKDEGDIVTLKLYYDERTTSRPSGGSSEPSYTVSVEDLVNGTVETDPRRAQEGEEVTITVTPDEGYEVDEVIVIDRDGEEVDVAEEGNGIYTFEMPDSRVTIEVTFVPVTEEPTTPTAPSDWVNPYGDVAANAWYYDAVAYVTANGLMTGTSATTFAPDATTTRAMIWTVLARMNGQNVDGGTPWYAMAQSWAVTANVSDGTNPADPISREELATMLYRAAGSPAVSGNLLSYPDGSSVAAWAESAMLWATQNGIISGIDGMLTPQGQATRAQVATMLMRFREAI